MSFEMAVLDKQSQQPAKRRHGASYVPWLPLVLGAVAAIAVGVWHRYASLALADVRVMADLITIPLPHAFSSLLPALLAASVALVVVLAALAWGLYGWRALQQYRADRGGGAIVPSRQQQLRPLAGCAGALTALQYVLVVWLAVMTALSMLWYGGGMVAAKATTDAVSTMAVVDDTLPRLIKTAMGIDPKKQGYLVHVSGRDVNIGSSTCSLFCFTLARAMLADTIDCTCNEPLAAQLMPPGNVTADITDPDTCSSAPVMCTINAYAHKMYKQQMKPATAAILVATLCALGMLCALSGTTARLTQELRRGDAISRSSSADADMRVSSGSGGGDVDDKAGGGSDQLPRRSGKVCNFV